MHNQGDIYIAQNEAGLKNRKPLNQYYSWQEVNTACFAGTTGGYHSYDALGIFGNKLDLDLMQGKDFTVRKPHLSYAYTCA